MNFKIFPKRHYLSSIIKKRLKALLQIKVKESKNPPKLKIHILKGCRRFLCPDNSINRIKGLGKITQREFRRIERFSGQGDFRRYLNKFKKGRIVYKYIYFCKGGLIFIDSTKGQGEIVYFTGEKSKGLKQWISHIIRTARYIFINLLLFAPGKKRLLLHAAGIEKKGEGYLFLGGNGSGKSTICSLSKKYYVLHDDMIAVEYKKDHSRFEIYSPDNPLNRANLKQIFFIDKSNKNRLENMATNEAFKEGLRNTINFKRNFIYQDFSKEKIDLAMELFKSIPCYRLYFKKDSTFWDLVERRKDD